ncbi:hypothetical protein [uncultured Brachyspira sp.]|uniref:hypothetical protein n=1 Tax=uncultured Brachyspira sp. TaxID=221953 RepID=UPI00261602AA|nr:hypothetical protein [uncultured Brachyspira sp.]
MNYNIIRNRTIKSILNEFLELIKNKENIELTEHEKSILNKELDCVIGTIEIINDEYSFEIKRNVIYLNIFEKYKITYKKEKIFLPEYFKLYFNEAIQLANEDLNNKMKKNNKKK